MQSHRAVILNAAMTAQLHLKTPLDTVVTALPCPHVYGNVVFNGAMMYGLKLVLHSRFEAGEILASIAAHKATMFEGVPTMYMYMLVHPGFDSFALSSLSRCTVGGQTMPVAKMEEVERRFGCPLIELWGMTELAGLGTTFPSYGPHKLGSIGIALPHNEARIADAGDAAKTIAAGEVGELMMRGPIVMKGYCGNEQATREAIEPDGWLHTGDLATMDEDGAIFIVDRKKDMINTGGFKVYPAEIERVIAAHPSVAMVAVGGQPDEIKGEIAKAYVVLKPGAPADAEGILAFCRDAARSLQGAARDPVRRRPAEDLDRQDHAARIAQARRVALLRRRGLHGDRPVRNLWRPTSQAGASAIGRSRSPRPAPVPANSILQIGHANRSASGASDGLIRLRGLDVSTHGRDAALAPAIRERHWV